MNIDEDSPEVGELFDVVQRERDIFIHITRNPSESRDRQIVTESRYIPLSLSLFLSLSLCIYECIYIYLFFHI